MGLAASGEVQKVAKFKCVMVQGNRWKDGAVYDGFPGGGDGCYNVMDESGAEWTITPSEDGFYRYIPNVQPSAAFAIVVE